MPPKNQVGKPQPQQNYASVMGELQDMLQKKWQQDIPAGPKANSTAFAEKAAPSPVRLPKTGKLKRMRKKIKMEIQKKMPYTAAPIVAASDEDSIKGALSLLAQGYIFESGKQGGKNDAGRLGGIYHFNDGKNEKKRILVKQDPHIEKNIGEFLAGKLMRAVLGERAAEIRLINTEEKPVSHGDGSNMYIGSVFIDNYIEDFYKTASHLAGETPPENRPQFVGSLNKGPVQAAMRAFCEDEKECEALCNIALMSLLTGNFDIHTGNIGVAWKNPSAAKSNDPAAGIAQQRLVTFDFGGAFKGLSTLVHPDSWREHLPGMGPTNHFREIPREIRSSLEMAKAAETIAGQDFSQEIAAGMQETGQYYGVQPLLKFAKRVGVQVDKAQQGDKAAVLQTLTNHLQQTTRARQDSLREFALEIRLDHCLAKSEDKWGIKEGDLEKLVKVAWDNKQNGSPQAWEYLQQRAVDGEFHFRRSATRGNFIQRHIYSREKKQMAGILQEGLEVMLEAQLQQAKLENNSSLNQPRDGAEIRINPLYQEK